MSPLDVDPPALLPDAPPVLGALAPALRRLAELQGQWPPQPPRVPRVAALAPDGTRASGRAAGDAAADEGVDLLVVEVEDASHAGLAVLAALLAVEPVHAVGTAGGPGWAERLGAVRAALPRLRPLADDPAALLDAAGDPALAHATGLLEQAAARRTPVLLGSAPGAVAALLLADRLSPGAGRWALPGSSSASPAAQRALESLALVPVLDLRLPGGGGAVLADGVLAAALELLGG